MKNLLIFSFITLFLSISANAANSVFIADAAAGANDGTSCANAKAASYFNTGGNWSATPSGIQIGPDTTVTLCGTFTGTAGSNKLTMQGSGTSGHNIILQGQSDTNFTAPYWSSTVGAIDSNGQQFFIWDGGGNGTSGSTPGAGTGGGIVQNSANGSALANQQDSIGLHVTGKHFIIRNWKVHHIYVRVADTVGTAGFDSVCIATGDEDDALITHNTADDCKQGIGAGNSFNNVSPIEISYNDTSYIEVPVVIAPFVGGVVMSQVSVDHNHHGTGAYLWDEPGNGFHHEAIHTFGNGCSPGCTIQMLYYSNLIDGVWGSDQAYFNMTGGTHITAYAFFEELGATGYAQIFNNVFDGRACPDGGAGVNCSLNLPDDALLSCKGAAGMVCNAYNNTFWGSGNDIGFTTGGTDGYTVKNNAFLGCYYTIYMPGQNITTGITADYNAYYQASDWGPAFDGFAGWQAAGHDANGKNGSNPNLNTTTFVPNAGSLLINAGVNLTSLSITQLDTDYYGVSRPGGATAWTIGSSNSGTGAPVLTLNVSSIAFGNQTTNTTSGAQAITATNVGSSTATISGVALATGTQFAMTNGSPSCPIAGGTVVAGGTCVVNVTFTPTTNGPKSDTVTFSSDGGNPTVALSGTGVTAGVAPPAGSSGGAIMSGGAIQR